MREGINKLSNIIGASLFNNINNITTLYLLNCSLLQTKKYDGFSILCWKSNDRGGGPVKAEDALRLNRFWSIDWMVHIILTTIIISDWNILKT